MRVVHDGTTFSFVNNQGALAAPYDADTKFRRAQPGDPFSPGDPYRPECYELLEVYQNPINSDSFFGILESYAQAQCNARIVVQFDTGLPPSPIRVLSFQPIP